MAKRVSESIIKTTSVALVAEPLGDPGGGEGGPDPHQGGLVRGGHHDDRAGEALGPEVALDELVHLPTTLADQGEDGDTAASVPRAIIESRLDLPTPEPAKMPSR